MVERGTMCIMCIRHTRHICQTEPSGWDRWCLRVGGDMHSIVVLWGVDGLQQPEQPLQLGAVDTANGSYGITRLNSKSLNATSHELESSMPN